MTGISSVSTPVAGPSNYGRSDAGRDPADTEAGYLHLLSKVRNWTSQRKAFDKMYWDKLADEYIAADKDKMNEEFEATREYVTVTPAYTPSGSLPGVSVSYSYCDGVDPRILRHAESRINERIMNEGVLIRYTPGRMDVPHPPLLGRPLECTMYELGRADGRKDGSFAKKVARLCARLLSARSENNRKIALPAKSFAKIPSVVDGVPVPYEERAYLYAYGEGYREVGIKKRASQAFFSCFERRRGSY